MDLATFAVARQLIQEGLKHSLKTTRKDFGGGLPVDLAACAAARHLTQEGLKMQFENQTIKVSSAVSPWTSRHAQQRSTSCMRIEN